MRRSLACNKVVKNSYFSKSLYEPKDHPMLHPQLTFQCQRSIQRGDITSQTAPNLGPWTYYEMFWPFCTSIYIFPSEFLEFKTVAKKTKI